MAHLIIGLTFAFINAPITNFFTKDYHPLFGGIICAGIMIYKDVVIVGSHSVIALVIAILGTFIGWIYGLADYGDERG